MTAEPDDVAARGERVDKAIENLWEDLGNVRLNVLRDLADAILASQRALAAELRGEMLTEQRVREILNEKTRGIDPKVQRLHRRISRLDDRLSERIDDIAKPPTFANWHWLHGEPLAEAAGEAVSCAEEYPSASGPLASGLRRGDPCGLTNRHPVSPVSPGASGRSDVIQREVKASDADTSPAPARDAERTELERRAGVLMSKLGLQWSDTSDLNYRTVLAALADAQKGAVRELGRAHVALGFECGELRDKLEDAEAEVARLFSRVGELTETLRETVKRGGEVHAAVESRLATAQELLRRCAFSRKHKQIDYTLADEIASYVEEEGLHLAAHAGGQEHVRKPCIMMGCTFDQHAGRHSYESAVMPVPPRPHAGGQEPMQVATKPVPPVAQPQAEITSPRPASAGARYVAEPHESQPEHGWAVADMRPDLPENRTYPRYIASCSYFDDNDRNRTDAERIAAALNADAGAMALVREHAGVLKNVVDNLDATVRNQPRADVTWHTCEVAASMLRPMLLAMRALAASAAREGAM